MAARGYEFYFRVLKVREIENTSWKALAYGIYTRFCIRNRTSERSERVRFLIRQQLVRK